MMCLLIAGAALLLALLVTLWGDPALVPWPAGFDPGWLAWKIELAAREAHADQAQAQPIAKRR